MEREYSLLEVANAVNIYMKENELDYEVVSILPTDEKYLFKVLAKYIGPAKFKEGTYTVWNCFNMSTNSLNYGYYDMTKENAYKYFLTGELSEVSKSELMRFARKMVEYINDINVDIDDEEQFNLFKELFPTNLTKAKMEELGIKEPKRYKKVQVEFTCYIDVIVPEDEECVDYSDYIKEEVDTMDINESCTELVIEDNIPKSKLFRYENDCYGIEEAKEM